MPSFLAIADFLRPRSLELGSTFIFGVRISFESFSGELKRWPSEDDVVPSPQYAANAWWD
jgi:hypothetical protein